MSLEDIAKLAGIAQSIGTVVALVVGAWWTYTAFIRRRQRYPRATIEHVVSSRQLMEGKVILSVDVIVRNPGEVLLRLTTGLTEVRQMVPAPHKLLDLLRLLPVDRPAEPQYAGWPLIASVREDWKGKRKARHGAVEIEPGEAEPLHYDFILDGSIQTVHIRSRVPNEVKPRDTGLGWERTTIYDVPDPAVDRFARGGPGA